ncbi:MAG: hypothetical protein HY315_00510 [Acidobacteria bacterium]|nr:hypothetical protein [Acidobacteriota bacterium]
MIHPPRFWKTAAMLALSSWIGIVAAGLLRSPGRDVPRSEAALPPAALAPAGYPQWVGYQPLPGTADSEVCEWLPGGGLFAAGRQDQLLARESLLAADDARTAIDADRSPRRVIHDPAPTYSAVAVDPIHNEVVLQDENLFQIMIYDRLANTPPQAAMTEPKRVIGGVKTKVEFNCGLYVDPKTGDIYSVNNDTVDTMSVFSRAAQGNQAPDRELHTPHGAYGIAVDEDNQEILLTVEHDNAVVAYRKGASGEEAPLRLIQGDRTGLGDPHGIAVDPKRNLIFVANHGSTHQVRPPEGASATRSAARGTASKENWPLDRDMAVPGSGRLLPPSITVYSRTAAGDVPPLRTIQGEKTQLNWPGSMTLDPERGELFVANDAGDSILVFRANDQGNVAPFRVLKGPKTGLKNPTGVFVDPQNQELWVSNFGNHSATVYKLTADGDTAPLRTIRAARRGKTALGIGNPGAVAYDSKRKEILVPN